MTGSSCSKLSLSRTHRYILMYKYCQILNSSSMEPLQLVWFEPTLDRQRFGHCWRWQFYWWWS